ncbi:MAG: GspE/PulE family protein [Bacteroidota bacterium]
MVNPQIDFRFLSLISAEQAHSLQIIPLERREGKLVCLTPEKTPKKKNVLRLVLGEEIELEVMEEHEFQSLLFQHYPIQHQQSQNGSKERSGSDVVQFVDKLFTTALEMGASDIHIERYEKLARIRFRWEGQLVERYEVQEEQYNAIISRIKILSELDIAERRLPQDGRIHLSRSGQEIDVRVSTIPTKFGEKVVMRLLTRSSDQLDLTKIGFSDLEMQFYQEAIRKPNGIVLITGPTGSGKTTTLYATLNQLNKPDKNITTIEDPIEYNLSGINQVQLKEEIGLTFDRALRAFLRQDPNIMMVGEIRDTPTAKIAVRAALAGRLVFSTLHTNNSWDAIYRLMDMGIEPYLLSASVRLIIAQRLVRVLCSCKTQSKEVIHTTFQESFELDQHYIPVGCPKCYFTGYKGRMAVFEVLPIQKDMQEAIKSKATDVNQFRQSLGLSSLNENLAAVVRRGESSIEEALQHFQ